jgi:hypothetical protein
MIHRLPLRVVHAPPRERAAKVIALEARRQARLEERNRPKPAPPRPTAA